MKPKRRPPRVPPPGIALEADLQSIGRRVTRYRRKAVIFSQGDSATDVRFVREGVIKLSVLSRTGREAVVATLAPGDFFGEGVLAGQKVRMVTAMAMTPCTVITVDQRAMANLLHDSPAFSSRFIQHMVSRNIQIESDLVDQLFNSTERRLARTLLLLARYGQPAPDSTLPRVSQETLAEMVGTTRTRVNFFMNKFRRLGLIEYNGDIKINAALLDVVLHDQ